MSRDPAGHLFLIVAHGDLRQQLASGLQQYGQTPICFADADECLQAIKRHGSTGFFVIISELGKASRAVEFLQQLRQSGQVTAVIFLDDHPARPLPDIVQAMRHGARGVVCSDRIDQLIAFVADALECSRLEFQREMQRRETLERLNQLNLGELQVLQGIMAGKLNKEIAHELELSVRTIEQRRRELFRKMDVRHPAMLARKVLAAAESPQLTIQSAASLAGPHFNWLAHLRSESVGGSVP